MVRCSYKRTAEHPPSHTTGDTVTRNTDTDLRTVKVGDIVHTGGVHFECRVIEALETPNLRFMTGVRTTADGSALKTNPDGEGDSAALIFRNDTGELV
jgi:hypothetical protein